jgi:hypothetical protein
MEATAYQGGRPYGIQAMIIGQQPDAIKKSSLSPSIFTVDPSGGYRHWVTATAIGRDAPEVRKQLFENIKKSPPTSADEALKTVLRACAKARPSLFRSTSGSSPESQIHALLVWNAGRQLRFGLVDSNQVSETRKAVEEDTRNESSLS